MKYLLLPFIVFYFLSCSSVRVNYDYDQSTDFSSYRTYNYFSDMATGLSDLDTKRLVEAIDSMMQTKGIKLSEEPEFLINIQSQSFYSPSNSSVGVGVGGTGGNVGGGVSIGVPLGGNSLERELVFDLVDTQKNQLFWQAISVSNLSDNAAPATREKKIYEIVNKVFAKYPPIKKSP
ncbi:MAG: DUF4136 domain-containing protein [Flavobacteriaceae bacterium]